MGERRVPACSVVVAAHDSARTVAAAIASVRLQTIEDWELLVVDDGSSDGTVEIVDAIRDERIRLIRQANRGPAAARNAGLRLARGSLVCTLDSDDLWMPDYLETMSRLLDKYPGAGVAYADAWALDDATGRIRRTSAMAYQHAPVPPPASPTDFLRALLPRNFVYNSVTMRRTVVEAVGGYDERFRTSEDWELWLRIAAAGYSFVRAQGRPAIYRHREGSLTSDLERMFADACEVYRVVEEEWDVAPEIKQRARSLAVAHRRKAKGVRGFPGGDPLLVARIAKRAVQRRTLWYRTPPPEVAVALAAIDALAAG
jgi:glycosyltransferase involved in cell wall biosynthesis